MTTSRKPVVLVTGQLLTNAIWTPQVDAFGSRFDLHFANHYSDDSIADMAARLLAEAPPAFDLVAHAMGGFIAFEVLRKAPERVASLALLSTFASADTPAQTERRQGYIRLVEAGRFPDIVEERIPMLVHPAQRENEALLGIVRNMALDTGQERFLAQQRAIMGRIDSRPALGAITCPTMILWGRQDGITTHEHQQEMVATIANARLEIVENCGHLMTIEQPATLSHILGDWLEDK